MRHEGMEAALRGKPATVEAVNEAAAGIGDGLDPPGDVHASTEYRRALAPVVARRAVCQAIGKGGDERG